LCEPLEITSNGKRLVVEDSAACQKTIQGPVTQQVLKTDGAGNLTWTNGASGTVLRKDSTGLLEFATLNSVLQSTPVDLGSQPLTTTGAINTASVTATGVVTAASVTAASVSLAANPTTNLQATTKQYVDAADALKLNKAGDTMTGALIVNSTIASNSTILATGNSSKIGYTSGGSVTQAGAKTNPVSLDRPTGTIIIHNAALAANTSVLFNLNNNLIQVNDLLLVTHISGGTVGAYNINAYIVGDFIGGIWIRNITSGSLSESLTLQFMLLKSAIA
jgi:hypothetical protein